MLPLLLLLPQSAPAPSGLGIEWLPVVSIVLPFLVLIAILLMGRKRV